MDKITTRASKISPTGVPTHPTHAIKITVTLHLWQVVLTARQDRTLQRSFFPKVIQLINTQMCVYLGEMSAELRAEETRRWLKTNQSATKAAVLFIRRISDLHFTYWTFYILFLFVKLELLFSFQWSMITLTALGRRISRVWKTDLLNKDTLRRWLLVVSLGQTTRFRPTSTSVPFL